MITHTSSRNAAAPNDQETHASVFSPDWLLSRSGAPPLPGQGPGRALYSGGPASGVSKGLALPAQAVG